MHIPLPPYIIANPSEHISDYDVLAGRREERDAEHQLAVVRRRPRKLAIQNEVYL